MALTKSLPLPVLLVSIAPLHFTATGGCRELTTPGDWQPIDIHDPVNLYNSKAKPNWCMIDLKVGNSKERLGSRTASTSGPDTVVVFCARNGYRATAINDHCVAVVLNPFPKSDFLKLLDFGFLKC